MLLDIIFKERKLTHLMNWLLEVKVGDKKSPIKLLGIRVSSNFLCHPVRVSVFSSCLLHSCASSQLSSSPNKFSSALRFAACQMILLACSNQPLRTVCYPALCCAAAKFQCCAPLPPSSWPTSSVRHSDFTAVTSEPSVRANGDPAACCCQRSLAS